MLRLSDVLGDFLWHGGLLSQALLVMSALGVILSLASGVTVVALRRAAFAVGTAALVVGALEMGLGAAAAWSARGAADARAAAADLEPVRERLRREGYEEARAVALAGLLLGTVPVIAGAAAVLSQGGRRRPRRALPRAGSRGALAAKDAVEPPPERPKSLLWGGVPALAAAALGLLSASAEIPGRSLDKEAWALLEHEAQIKAGRMAEGCSGLERDLRSLGRAEADPIAGDLVGLTDACLRHRLDVAADRSSAASELLRGSPLVLEEAQRERLKRDAAGGAPK